MELIDKEKQEKTVSKIGKTSSAFAQNEYIEQNKERIVTDEEYAILKDYSELLGIKLYKSIKAVKKEDENKQTVYRFIGFKRTETGQIAEMMLAINHYYGRTSTERIFFDSTGKTHILSVNQIDQARSYLANEWKNSVDKKVPQKIATYVQNRWNDSDFTTGRYSSLITSFFRNTYLCIDPFVKAVELRAKEIQSGKVKPVEFKEFFNELSDGISENEYEPYRERAIRLLLKAPLIIRNSRYTGQGIQNMVIFVGHQGIGKSTLCEYLGLGYEKSIKDVSATDQETAMLRASNVILENGELSSFSKAETEKMKNAITMRSISVLMKYQNTETTFDCVAMLVGTTNNFDFLKDATGERRFLPIKLIRWNINVMTKNWFLTAYATEYLKLFVNNDKYQYIDQLEEDIESKKSALLRAGNSTQASEIKDELFDLESNYDEYLQAFNQEYLDLNIKESQTDLEYKKANFGQADRQLDLVRKALQEAVDDPSSTIASRIIRVRKENFIGFAPKQILDKAVVEYIKERYPDEKIYTNKASNWVLSHGNLEQIWLGQGVRNVRAIKVKKDELDKMLDMF